MLNDSQKRSLKYIDIFVFWAGSSRLKSNLYSIDTTFTGSSVTVGSVTYYLGQSFGSGLSGPDINIKSGEIIYVDNRSSVTRASQQREDIKIVLEF